MTVRIGLVGYGVGGRFFHAPYIEASDRCELVGVVARRPERIAEVRDDLPGVPVLGSLAALIDAGVDAVVVSTPPATHRDLALEAIGRGIPVVVDKPFAFDAAEAREMAAAAEAAGVPLGVFHNRRWDTDVVTLRGVLDSGALGEVWRFDSRFDLDEAHSLEPGPAGGLLRDLGSHLVDQALALFGPAAAVSAQLDWVDRTEGRTDAGFVVTIEHRGGVHSHISSSKLSRLVNRELRVLAAGAGYVSSYRDVQAQAIFAGRRPADDRAGWGWEDEERWGVLRTAEGDTVVPSAQGDYTLFYDGVADAVEHGRPMPVPAADAVALLEVLDAARVSALERRTVLLPAG